MDPDFHITTPRLYLSYLQADNDSHCDLLVKLWNTPEFIAACGKTSITTREAARKEIGGRFVDDQKRNGYGIYLVSLRQDATSMTGDFPESSFQDVLDRCKHIGTVSLMRGKPPKAFAAPDLGFAILPEEGRRGYAREASQVSMDYAETSLGVPDILGLFNPDNEGSKAVFRSLGFRDCGVKDLEEFSGLPVAIWVNRGMDTDVSFYNVK